MTRRRSRPPLHQQIADLLRRSIRRQHQPGDRLPSEAALAQRYAVSLVTMREALSALAQEGLVERRHGSGTYVLDEASRGPVTAVMIELDIAHPRTSPFYRSAVQTLQQRLREAGHRVRLYAGHTPPDAPAPKALTCPEVYDDLARGRIAGVVAVGMPSDPAWRKPFDDAGVPVVGGSKACDYCVEYDLGDLARQGVAALAQAGRRRLAAIMWSPTEPAGSGPQVWRQALAEHGLAFNPAWLRTDLHPASVGAGWEQVRDLWSAGPEKPDGLLVTDDILFTDVAMALLEMNVRVPDELAVVTHANKNLSPVPPFPVTRIEYDPLAFADRLVDLLSGLMAGQAVAPRAVRLSPEVVPVDTWLGGPRDREQPTRRG